MPYHITRRAKAATLCAPPRRWPRCTTGPNCKLGEGKFIRNFVSTSNDIVAIAEQLDPVPVNVYHFRRTFKPQEIIPDIDFLRLC